MPSFYLFSIEGVLADLIEDTDPIASAPPIMQGRELWEAAKATGDVGLVTSQTDSEMVNDWLQRERIEGWNDLAIGARPRADAIEGLRRRGWYVRWYIDADPSMSARALHYGVTALTFTHPRYARPEWRPGSAPKRSWAELVGESEAQRTAWTNDRRLEHS